jgi:hypothetical protein
MLRASEPRDKRPVERIGDTPSFSAAMADTRKLARSGGGTGPTTYNALPDTVAFHG